MKSWRYKSIGTQWVALLFVNGDNGSTCYDATYFDSFAVEHIPEKLKQFIGDKNFVTNFYKIKLTIQ